MSNYAKLKQTLLKHGADYQGFVEKFFPDELNVSAEKWLLNGVGLIVLTDNETEQIGIYAFVGTDGSPVDEDVAFIGKIAAATNPVCGLIET